MLFRSEALIGSVKVMLDAYDEGRLDRLYVVYNEFVNTMTQKPVVRQLLPLDPSMGLDAEDEDNKRPGSWDYLYEPDAKALLDSLLVRFIESQVYQAVVENAACEQAARMIAMKNATDNAGGLIDEREMVYHKSCQGSITREISGSVWGAEVLEDLDNHIRRFWLVKPKAASLRALLKTTLANPQYGAG